MSSVNTNTATTRTASRMERAIDTGVVQVRRDRSSMLARLERAIDTGFVAVRRDRSVQVAHLEQQQHQHRRRRIEPQHLEALPAELATRAPAQRSAFTVYMDERWS